MLFSNRYIYFDKVINRLLSLKNIVWRKLSPSKTASWLMGVPLGRNELIRNIRKVVGNLNTVDISILSDVDKSAIIYAADKTMQHEFNVLGSGWTKLEPIDWHCDFKSGKRWTPGRFYLDYVTVSKNGGFDIKTVWDLNRCLHLVWLAEAYSLTKNEKYVREIIDQISSWIDVNPLMYTVAWTCSMDVAIRAINWIYALAIISETSLITDDIAKRIGTSLYEHVFFIINNLEKTIPYSGNHYLSDLVGLLLISKIFPENRFANYVFKFALKEYYRECLIQISPDGTNYEHSVSYHRLVLELFIVAYAMLSRNGYIIPENVTNRLVKAVDFVATYTKQSGLSPLFGDNDNGRVCEFTPRDYRQHGYLCSVGQRLFRRRYKDAFFTAEQIYINEGIINGLDKDAFINPEQRYFLNNGMAIVRDQNVELYVNNSDFSILRNQIGVAYGTHTHPDCLSFELSICGYDFIVDPGTYVYTSDKILRNYFRGTASHSTILVDGLNQTEFATTNIFVQTNFTKDHSIKSSKIDGTIRVDGSYVFDDGQKKFIHYRSFELKKNVVTIKDKIVCPGTHSVDINYPLDSLVKLSSKQDKIVMTSSNVSAVISVNANNNPCPLQIKDAMQSPSYGIKIPSKKLYLRVLMCDQIEIITLIIWEKK